MSDSYSRTLARVAAGQLAEATGFDAAQQSALEALSDVLIRYIVQVGASSHSYAEMAGRTETNVYDLLLAFEDLGIDYDEIVDYTKQEEEVPFAHSLSSYPVQRMPKRYPTFEDVKEEPPAHIAPFLPAFPNKHTYQSTPVFPNQDKTQGAALNKWTQSRKAAEQALVNLSNRAAAAAATAVRDDGQQDVSNPFLAPTRWEEGSSDQDWELFDQEVNVHKARQPATTAFQPILNEIKQAAGGVGDAPCGWRPEEPGPPSVASSHLQPRATLSFDLTTKIREAALKLAARKPIPDAFQEHQEIPGRESKRKRKLTSKAAAMQEDVKDPQQKRAEDIINAAFMPDAVAAVSDDVTELQFRERI